MICSISTLKKTNVDDRDKHKARALTTGEVRKMVEGTDLETLTG